jgi:type 1 fimbria pilin
MTKIKNNMLFVSIITAAVFSACKDDKITPNNPPSNSTELITTMKVLLTDSATSQVYPFVFRDTDGEGGAGPTQFDTIQLTAGHVYYSNLLLLDESKATVDTISNEVLEEADEHLVFYDITGANVSVRITDKDSKQLPLGMQSIWRTGAASSGKITIQLKHQPGVKDGSRAPGETDAMVEFQLKIQ